MFAKTRCDTFFTWEDNLKRNKKQSQLVWNSSVPFTLSTGTILQKRTGATLTDQQGKPFLRTSRQLNRKLQSGGQLCQTTNLRASFVIERELSQTSHQLLLAATSNWTTKRTVWVHSNSTSRPIIRRAKWEESHRASLPSHFTSTPCPLASSHLPAS